MKTKMERSNRTDRRLYLSSFKAEHRELEMSLLTIEELEARIRLRHRSVMGLTALPKAKNSLPA